MKTPTETSPYNLLQEQLHDHPWRLLVACVMLNQTTAVQVKKVIWKFFERWPTAEAFLSDPKTSEEEDDLTEFIRPLGFYNRRATTLRRMTQMFENMRHVLEKHPTFVCEIYGIGKYAVDSYMMFVGGFVIDDVQDKELKNYVRWAHARVECGHSGEQKT